MTNEQNNSFQIEMYSKREPSQVKATIKIDAENGKPIDKLLKITAFSKIVSSEAVDADTILQGETVVFALYKTDTDEMISVKNTVSWQDRLPSLGAVTILATPKVVEYDILGQDEDGVMVNLVHSISIGEVSRCDVGAALEENIGLEKDVETIDIVKVVGANNTIFTVSDEWDENFSSESRILSRDVSVDTINQFAGIDNVTVEGELTLNMLVGNDTGVEMIKRKIPFKNELECFGTNPNNIVLVALNVSSIMAGIRESTEKSSTIAVDIEINAQIVSSQAETVEVVKDCYSAVQDTKLSVESVNFSSILATTFVESNTQTSALLDGKTGVDEVLAVINPEFSVTATERNNDKLQLYGNVDLSIVYKNNELNTINTFDAVCPLTFEFDCGENYDNIDSVSVSIESYKLKAGSEIQILINAVVGISKQETKQVVYVSNVEYSDEERVESSAIKVYVVKDGDRVFDIAKKLGVTMSNLISQNPDLDSGVVAGEKVYMYIPVVANF